MEALDKKVESVGVVNDPASPEARSQRLRRIRNLANLSRQEICDTEELKFSTYKGWEIVRHGGLTLEGAKKVLTRISKEGVVCSLDWLYMGKGQPPYVILDEPMNSDTCEITQRDRLVKNEYSIYREVYSTALLCKIKDDAMRPDFHEDDYVCGLPRTGEGILSLLGHSCIVELLDGSKIVRILLKGKGKNKFTLMPKNQSSTTENAVISETDILTASPITRFYRNIGCSE